jgi:hypothetical protein
MANSFKFDSKSLLGGFEEVAKKEAAIAIKLQTEATEVQDYMKQHAPWTDRTGQARRSLNTSVGRTNTGYRITLAHGVDYGIWLELAHEKRFAIIEPTIQSKGQQVIKSFENFMSKL